MLVAKAGQIFKHDGNLFQCVESRECGCEGCFFNKPDSTPCPPFMCVGCEENDYKSVVFKKIGALPDVSDTIVDGQLYYVKKNMTMERKIGEIFEHNGEWYQCVKVMFCDFCAFDHSSCAMVHAKGRCSAKSRKDETDVVFKKLEKVGKPFEKNGCLYQEYKAYRHPLLMSGDDKIPTDNGFAVIIKQNKEAMEENKLRPFNLEEAKEGKRWNAEKKCIEESSKQKEETGNSMGEHDKKELCIPDGYEFDCVENGKVVLKRKESVLPENWDDCLRSLKTVEYITFAGEIGKCEDIDQCVLCEGDWALLPVGYGKAMLALYKLLVCRNAWWKALNWRPDWKDENQIKYSIYTFNNDISTIWVTGGGFILSFPTIETRDKFLETFRDLIDDAKSLL